MNPRSLLLQVLAVNLLLVAATVIITALVADGRESPALITGALVGARIAGRFTGVRRALVAVGVFLLLVALLTALSFAADGLSHTLYHGGNRGIHKECGIFVLGLAALAIGSLPQRPSLHGVSLPAQSAGSGSR